MELGSRPPGPSWLSRSVSQLVAEEVAVAGLQVDFYGKMIAHLKSLRCHKQCVTNESVRARELKKSVSGA